MGQPRILIVEDERIVAKDIQNRLVKLGYEVTGSAASGQDAMRLAGDTHPDLILMDIMLQGDLDGVQTAEAIRRQFHIPVVYLTAYSDTPTLQRAKVTEPFGYLLKPFEERDLHITIQMALYKHRMERKLEESEQWLATILRSTRDAVVTTDRRGEITYINPAAEILTGWSRHEALGRPVTEVVRLKSEATGESIEGAAEIALRSGAGSEPSEHRLLVTTDGGGVPIEESAAPITDQHQGVLGVVLVFRDITTRKTQAAALEYQSLHDALTGLPNRTLLGDRLQQAILIGHREHRPLALVFVELTGFQDTRRALGRYNGDLILQQLGQRIWDVLRRSDTVARWSDETFTVLLPGAGESAVRVVERLLGAVRRPFELDSRSIEVRVHVGIALCPDHGDDADTLIRCAETAVATAKQRAEGYAIYDGDGEPSAPPAVERFSHR